MGAGPLMAAAAADAPTVAAPGAEEGGTGEDEEGMPSRSIEAPSPACLGAVGLPESRASMRAASALSTVALEDAPTIALWGMVLGLNTAANSDCALRSELMRL